MWRWRLVVVALLAVGAAAIGFGLTHGRHDGDGRTSDPSAARQAESDAPTKAQKAQIARAADLGLMYFTGLQLDTSGQAPQACLNFTLRLGGAASVHVEDFIRIEPAVKASLQVEGDRLCIGGLAFDKSYSVTIAQGLPADTGAATLAPEMVAVSFGEMPPEIGFGDSGFILSRDEVAGLPIETVNVDKVKVTVARIGDRILARTELGRGWQDIEGAYDADTGTVTNTIAVPVWTGELSVRKRLNERVVTGFPIAEVLSPRKPGAYSVTVERVKPPGESTQRVGYVDPRLRQRWIFDTDLMMTSFAGQDGLHVFVRSLKTARPVAGAEVALIAANNDELGVVKADDNGQAVFAAGLTRGTGALAPRMLMAYKDDDFTAMELNRPALDLSSQDVAGREEARAVDAFLYTDRGVYRRGETVQATGLIRDRIGKALSPTPVALVLRRPDGVEAGRWRVDPNEAGALVQPIALSPTAPHGGWRIEASLAGDDQIIGRVGFQVQDFVPQRLKVAAKAEPDALSATAPTRLDVNARYLFGAPADGLAVEGHLNFIADPDPVAEKGWRFGLVEDRLESEPQDLTIPATDANGDAMVSIAPSSIRLPDTSLPYKAVLTAAVVEPGGRTTDATLQLPVRTGKPLLGLRPVDEDGRVQEGQRARVEAAEFDADGRRIGARADYRLIALIDSYEYFAENGNWQWKRFTRERPMAVGKVTMGGESRGGGETPGLIETPTLDWGRYRLEVTDPESGARSSIMLNAGWQAAGEENPAPETVALSVEGGPVKAGEVAHIHIKPPFAGEALLTIAGSRVFASRTLSVPAEGRTVDIKGDPDWGPGAYVVVSLYRPQAAAQGHAPVRAVGAVWLPLDVQDRTLSVAIAAPPVARPRGRLDVPVTVGGAQSGESVYVTLAAVDEGILQLTRFTAPDPNGYYFGKRRLAVDIRDDYAHLIDGDAGDAGTIRQGGDSGGAGLPATPTKTVALFSGLVKIGSDGKATIPLDLPDFNGGLRLMAVAFGTSGLGHADALMAVRDPVVAELSLPRFLAPGDDARMTLLLGDVDGAAGTYHVHIAASGSAAAPPVDQDIDLGAAEQKISTYALAGGDPGAGELSLTLTGPGGIAISHSWPIQIRPPHVPLTLGTVAMQAPGESFTLDPNLLKAFLPGAAKVTIGFSTLRGIDLPGLITALDRYPYGCSEQLVSAALPLVYLQDLKMAAASAAPDDEHLRVQEAINRLLEREGGDGAFGLWRLEDHLATPYLGAYIVDFLARAKAKGYAVPDEALARAYDGIGDFVIGGSWRTAVFWAGPGAVDRREPVLAGEAYADYVRARAKRADIGTLRYLHDTAFDQLEPVAKAQLGAALALMGDRARAAHALDAAEQELTQPRPAHDWAGDYYRSTTRDIAIVLSLAAELGDSDRVERLTALLEQQDTRTESLSTQEQAWLAVAAATLLGKGGPVAIGVNHQPATPTRPPVTLNPDPAAIAAGYQLDNRGTGAVFRAVTVFGVPAQPPSAMANLVEIAKSVTTIDGAPVDLNAIRQNDRLVVHLSGKADDLAYHQGILVDMLPAGWEIEAIVPRGTAKEGNGFSWLGPITRAKTEEKRDDRFVAAIDLNAVRVQRLFDPNPDNEDRTDPRTFNLAYIVRAVTPGRFVLPAAVVQDMYRPPVMARTAVGAVTIAGKK
jgi:uncharacterized protein YfaS (alpha-2-macroglobulin family)